MYVQKWPYTDGKKSWELYEIPDRFRIYQSIVASYDPNMQQVRDGMEHEVWYESMKKIHPITSNIVSNLLLKQGLQLNPWEEESFIIYLRNLSL